MIRSTTASVLLALATLLCFPAVGAEAARAASLPSHRSGGTAIFIDGIQVRAAALSRGGRVFVPLRGVLERLGASVRFSRRGSVIVGRDGVPALSLTVGKRRALLHGRKYDLGAAPLRAHGRLYVPLRAVAAATGASVTYHSRPVYISIFAPAPAFDRVTGPVGGSYALAAAMSPSETVAASPAGGADGASLLRILGGLAIAALLGTTGGYAWWRRHVSGEPSIVSRTAPRDML